MEGERQRKLNALIILKHILETMIENAFVVG
jgi:hypothetical protein